MPPRRLSAEATEAQRVARRAILPVGALLLLAITPATAAAQSLEVAPGTVVRWPGEAIERCGMGERVWPPLGGACWYSVDLLEPQGALKVRRWLRNGRPEVGSVTVGAYPYETQRITLRDETKVDLSAADLERVRQENRRIAALWNLETERRFELPLAPPLAALPPGGRFGARRYFNDQPRSPHTGVDFAAEAGTPILAVAAGSVALVGDFFFPGKSVFLDHGDGLVSMYFHMSGIAVEKGDSVDRGEVLGLVGDSGRATGPHLHLGIRWRGDRIDPRLLMQPVSEIPALP